MYMSINTYDINMQVNTAYGKGAQDDVASSNALMREASKMVHIYIYTCVCVCVCVRERERESVCVCVCV
jgi:hypothetical protein